MDEEQDQLPCGSTETLLSTRYHNLIQTIPQGTLKVGDAMFGRGNAGWTTSKSGHPCPRQNYSQWPSAEKDRNRISAESFLVFLRLPNRSRDWTEQPRRSWDVQNTVEVSSVSDLILSAQSAEQPSELPVLMMTSQLSLLFSGCTAARALGVLLGGLDGQT